MVQVNTIENISKVLYPMLCFPFHVAKPKKKSDVWSFGIVLYELFGRGLTPYVGMTNYEVAEKVLAGFRLPKPTDIPDNVTAKSS